MPCSAMPVSGAVQPDLARSPQRGDDVAVAQLENPRRHLHQGDRVAESQHPAAHIAAMTPPDLREVAPHGPIKGMRRTEPAMLL